MRKIRLSSTDILIPRLAFGTASIHHLRWRSDRINALSVAIDHGFTHIDTSPYYGFGLAEDTIGRLPVGVRNSITVASKVGLYPKFLTRSWYFMAVSKFLGKIFHEASSPEMDWSIQRAEASLEGTLRRLRREYVDILYLHEPCHTSLDGEVWLNWLNLKKSEGKLLTWGLAGEPELIMPFCIAKSPLTKILQVRDSIERNEAGILRNIGYVPQFVYGYIRASVERNIKCIVEAAILRNPSGSIIVGTTRLERILELACIAEDR